MTSKTVARIYTLGFVLAVVCGFVLLIISETKENICSEKIKQAFKYVPRTISLETRYNMFNDYCAAIMRSTEIEVVTK